MRVFVAGGTGVIGRRLVPQLVARGHQVTATTTSAGKLGLLEQLGAEGVVMDGLDAASVGEAVAAARPDAIVNQMTALSVAHSGKPNPRKPDRFFAATNRLRSEGIDHLLAAAEATGVSHVVAQGHASMNGIRDGGWVKTEEDPLEVVEGTKAINHLEDVVVRAGGAVLRYGGFYGPGAHDEQIHLVRKRLLPLVGGGTGYVSWVHVDDAANATVLAVEQKAHGVFNIVDDEPAPVSVWLPYLAECVGAKPPRRVPAWLARLLAGEMAVGVMTEGRGFSNAKAKRELGWELRYPSWRQGFQGRAAHDPGRGVRGAAAAPVRDRLPDPRQRGRGRGRGPGDLAALRVLPDPAHVDQGVPLGRGHAGLDRRAALGARPAGDVRRAVVPRAVAHRPLRGSGAVGGAGGLGVDGGPVAARAADPARTGGLRAAGGVRVRLSRDRGCRRAVGGGVPPARGPGATPHGRRAPSVRGGPPGTRGAGGAVLRRAPGWRRRRTEGVARCRRPDGRGWRRQGACACQERDRCRQRGPRARVDLPGARPDRRETWSHAR